MSVALHLPQVHRELSHDARFRWRIIRLTGVSMVALGVITVLAAATLRVPWWVVAMLAAGSVLMPLVLAASLREPRLRYALTIPASLVTLALFAIVAWWLPVEPVALAGWLLITAGILVGAGLGAWFWYRMMPVPAALDDPFSGGRWALVALHIGLLVVGFALAATALLG